MESSILRSLVLGLSLVLVACRTSGSKEDAAAPVKSKSPERPEPSLSVKLAVAAKAPSQGEPVGFTGRGTFVCAHRHEADLACFGRRMPVGSSPVRPTLVRSAGTDIAEFIPHALGGVRDTEVYAELFPRCLVDAHHQVRCTDPRGRLTKTKVDTAKQISVGWFKCAVRPSGGAECWGQDVCKRDGEAKYAEYELHKLDVPGLDDPIQVDGDPFSVCALDRDGEVYCHGYRHRDDRCLIDGWERVPEVERAVEIAVINSSACALEESGLVSCWGGKDYGHLGVEVEGTEHLRDPVALTQLSPVYRLRSYEDSACVLRANGEIWCWGEFMRNTGNQVTPQRIDIDPSIDVIVGDDFACALLPDRSIRCFGERIDRWRKKYFPSQELLPFEGKKPWTNPPTYTLDAPPPSAEPNPR